MVTLFSLYIDIPPIPTNDFLLHQINYVQQDSDHVEAVEILGSTVDCISNEGDTNEWEEESDIGMYVQYICACIMFAICESNVVLFWPYVCPYNGMYYVRIYQQYIYIYICAYMLICTSYIEDEIEVSSQAHSVERFLSESESIHNQCASIEGILKASSHMYIKIV